MDAKELEGLIAEVAAGNRSELVIRDADLDGLSGADERRIGGIVRKLADAGSIIAQHSPPGHHPVYRTIMHPKRL